MKELTQFKLSYEEFASQYHVLENTLKTTLKSKADVDKQNANLLEDIALLKKSINDDLFEISCKRREEKEQYEFSQRLLI